MALHISVGTPDGGDLVSGNRYLKVLIMGLPGAGKTTLARALVRHLNAVHFNADEIRANINRDLGFSLEDRVEQARRIGWLCDRVTATGNFAVADLVCPTRDTRVAFASGAPAFTVWMDRIGKGRFEDTNQLFTAPQHHDLRVPAEGTPEYWAEQVAARVRPARSADPAGASPACAHTDESRPPRHGWQSWSEDRSGSG